MEVLLVSYTYLWCVSLSCFSHMLVKVPRCLPDMISRKATLGDKSILVEAKVNHRQRYINLSLWKPCNVKHTVRGVSLVVHEICLFPRKPTFITAGGFSRYNQEYRNKSTYPAVMGPTPGKMTWAMKKNLFRVYRGWHTAQLYGDYFTHH